MLVYADKGYVFFIRLLENIMSKVYFIILCLIPLILINCKSINSNKYEESKNPPYQVKDIKGVWFQVKGNNYEEFHISDEIVYWIVTSSDWILNKPDSFYIDSNKIVFKTLPSGNNTFIIENMTANSMSVRVKDYLYELNKLEAKNVEQVLNEESLNWSDSILCSFKKQLISREKIYLFSNHNFSQEEIDRIQKINTKSSKVFCKEMTIDEAMEQK